MKGNTFAATEWRQYPNWGGTFLDAGIHDVFPTYIFSAVEYYVHWVNLNRRILAINLSMPRYLQKRGNWPI